MSALQSSKDNSATPVGNDLDSLGLGYRASTSSSSPAVSNTVGNIANGSTGSLPSLNLAQEEDGEDRGRSNSSDAFDTAVSGSAYGQKGSTKDTLRSPPRPSTQTPQDVDVKPVLGEGGSTVPKVGSRSYRSTKHAMS